MVAKGYFESMSSFSAPIMTSSGLKMTRVWSRGGVASSVCVDGFVEEIGKGFTKRKDEMFLFDCGYLDEVTKEAKHVFITHGHTGRYSLRFRPFRFDVLY